MPGFEVGEAPLPGSREWYALRLYGGAQPADAATARANRNTLATETGYMTPGIGEAMSARDAWGASGEGARALGEGRWGDAVGSYGNMLAAGMGAIPGIGVIARGFRPTRAAMDRALPGAVNRGLDNAMPSDPKNTLNVFAGPTAKTADHAALKQAREMAAAGADRGDIWRETGWFVGQDGKWRFEIDDSQAQFRPDNVKAKMPSRIDLAGDYVENTLGLPRHKLLNSAEHQPAAFAYADENFAAARAKEPGQAIDTALDHDALFAAYPQFRNIGIANETAMGVKGSFNGNRITFGGQGYAPANEHLSTVLHELQHKIQREEDFARGGWWGDMANEAETRNLARDKYAEMRRNGADLSDEDMRANAMTEAAKERYRSLAGETEARNVQARQNFTHLQRWDRTPWGTQDVPDNRQIVRMQHSTDAMNASEKPFFDLAEPDSVSALPQLVRVVSDDMPQGSIIFDIKHSGLTPGFVSGGIDPNDPTKFIVYAIGAPGGANSLGHAATRNLLRQLKEQLPGLTKIGGTRLTGARSNSGAGVENAKMEIALPSYRRGEK